MEKLVKLLNEYEVYKGYNGGGWEMTSMGLVYAKNIRDKGAIVILKSKEYGFIERLVKNDKIEHIRMYQILETPTTYYDTYESMLMRLSIHDNPIEYLCSILKE